MITDTDRLNFIEERSRLSRTGITFEWCGQGTYRYIEHRYLGKQFKDVRSAIDQEIGDSKWSRK